MIDLTEDQQQRCLNLLLAAILYLNAKAEKPNPFVRVIGPSNEERALEILANATNNLEDLLPLLPEITEAQEDSNFEDVTSVFVEDNEI